MKIDEGIAEQLRIPTKGMQEFRITYRQFDSLLTEATATKFYRDQGQLHQPDESEVTDLMYLVQREDGVVKVVPAGLMGVNAYHILKEHLDPDVKAEVIECRVPRERLTSRHPYGYLAPELGVLSFFAFHHPDWVVRKGLSRGLLEREDAQANSSCSH